SQVKMTLLRCSKAHHPITTRSAACPFLHFFPHTVAFLPSRVCVEINLLFSLPTRHFHRSACLFSTKVGARRPTCCYWVHPQIEHRMFAIAGRRLADPARLR